jgi:type VI secretion system protein ImpM
LSTLLDGATLDGLEAPLPAIPLPDRAAAGGDASPPALAGSPVAETGLCVVLADARAAGGVCASLLPVQAARMAPYSLWWTDGSGRVAPVLVIARGLPPPDAFAAMLDGKWSRGGWRLERAPAAHPAPPVARVGPRVREK